MSIKRLLLETAFILFMITLAVIVINTLQIRQNDSVHFDKLREEYFDATYEIYKDEIIGNILLGDKSIETALFDEIAKRRKIIPVLSYQNPNTSRLSTSEYSSIKNYEISLGDDNVAILSLYPKDEIKRPWILDDLIAPLVLETLLLSIGFIYIWRRFTKCILFPLSDLVSHLTPEQIGDYFPSVNTIKELHELIQTLKRMNIEIQNQSVYQAEINTSKQVGHDIRSPLACLVLLLSQASSLPENQRTLMRSAIQRITDIANSLHRKALKNKLIDSSPGKIEISMISSVVESLITEKRMQLRERENIEINLNIENAYGLFSPINAAELKRVLSNLINNSVEAFDSQPHQITVIVEHVHKAVQIKIHDNGHGMPEEILKKIGQPGFSYGKESHFSSGTGLGIYAIKIISSFNGEFSIDSVLNQGTTVIIKLPCIDTPPWCVKAINLKNIQQIIVLDDDQSIHNLWRDRINRLNHKNIKLFHFSCVAQFKNIYTSTNTFHLKNQIFLVDLEFLNQKISGLDVIEELKIEKQSILVTSHYDDPIVKEKASQLGIGMIPKGIAAFVPIV